MILPPYGSRVVGLGLWMKLGKLRTYPICVKWDSLAARGAFQGTAKCLNVVVKLTGLLVCDCVVHYALMFLKSSSNSAYASLFFAFCMRTCASRLPTLSRALETNKEGSIPKSPSA